MRERERDHDDYWTDDLLLGEVALPREPALVRLRWHQSEERIRDHEELLPLAHKTGPRVYVHARPYVLEPAITLTVGLSPTPTDTGAIGEVVGSAWEGMRHREIGQAQAWYDPLDRLLMLWECYVRPGATRWIAAAGGESKEDTLSGHPAHLAAKANGDRSMPGTWGPVEGVYAGAPLDPRETVNAGLREAQSPAVPAHAPR